MSWWWQISVYKIINNLYKNRANELTITRLCVLIFSLHVSRITGQIERADVHRCTARTKSVRRCANQGTMATATIPGERGGTNGKTVACYREGDTAGMARANAWSV